MKKRSYHHRVTVTYTSGTMRKKYEGTDAQEAEKAFLAAKGKWLDGTNVWAVSWHRDGELHQHV